MNEIESCSIKLRYPRRIRAGKRLFEQLWKKLKCEYGDQLCRIIDRIGPVVMNEEIGEMEWRVQYADDEGEYSD